MVLGLMREIRLSVLLAIVVISGADARESVQWQAASELARNNFIRSVTVMSKEVEVCESKAKIIDIPHWKQLGTDRESLLLGIKYYYFKRDNECLSQAAKDLLMAVKMVEISGMPDWEKEPSTGFVDMVLVSWWKELEAEARYRSRVSSHIQKKIDEIPGLRQPFKLIPSWDSSGNR